MINNLQTKTVFYNIRPSLSTPEMSEAEVNARKNYFTVRKGCRKKEYVKNVHKKKVYEKQFRKQMCKKWLFIMRNLMCIA